MPSVSVKDVDQQKFVKALSAFLKRSGKMNVPDWVDLVKTGTHKELAPFEEDWYYTRCAALARRLYMRSPVGTGTVRKIFGGRKRNGTTPAHFRIGPGSVARRALQSLESLKLVEKVPDGGRRLSPQGRRDLDRLAAQIKCRRK